MHKNSHYSTTGTLSTEQHKPRYRVGRLIKEACRYSYVMLTFAAPEFQ